MAFQRMIPGAFAVLLLSCFTALAAPQEAAGSTSTGTEFMASPAAVSSDDRENTTPTSWWVYSGQSTADVSNFINANNARIVDLYIESISPLRYTVTYVSNTGAYAKGWWWYAGDDETALNNHLSANNARLTVLKAYDIGGGQIRFAAVMVSNTGADAKGWWWYYGQTTAGVTSLWQANNARLVQVNSYVTSGQTRYAVVMISNTGADAKSWWWYVNATVGDIVTHLNTNQARLLDLDHDATTGNYNVIMEQCSTGCPLWWWYVGSTGQQVLDNSAQNGGRVIDLNSSPGCGSVCYSYLMINNSNAITSRVGQILRQSDGVKGLYLKEVGGSVLANLEDTYVFEPASALKAVIHLYSMHEVQLGTVHLTDLIPKYLPPSSGSCPGNTAFGTESLSTAMGEMMRHSDNTRTREIADYFGTTNINLYAGVIGLLSTHINHIIGCGGPIPDQTTLNDFGHLYEGVANGTLLNATNRDLFYSLMAGKAQFQLEGYDWTGLWTTDIPNIINQEALAGMPAALKQAFRDRMNLAYKAGNYKICGATCATYVDHIAIAGWAEIPFCGRNNPPSRQYVFGTFINNATSDTVSSNTFNASKSELLREQIHAGLASCFNQIFMPEVRK